MPVQKTTHTPICHEYLMSLAKPPDSSSLFITFHSFTRKDAAIRLRAWGNRRSFPFHRYAAIPQQHLQAVDEGGGRVGDRAVVAVDQHAAGEDVGAATLDLLQG